MSVPSLSILTMAFAIFVLGLTALPRGAQADPPDWAPANGWRHHHHHHDDDEDERRYYGAPVIVAPAPPVVYAPPMVYAPPVVAYPAVPNLNIILPLHLR